MKTKIESKWAGPAKIFIIHQMLATILSLLVFRIDWYWSKPFYISNINRLLLAKSFSFSHTNLLILTKTLRLFIYKPTDSYRQKSFDFSYINQKNLTKIESCKRQIRYQWNLPKKHENGQKFFPRID